MTIEDNARAQASTSSTPTGTIIPHPQAQSFEIAEIKKESSRHMIQQLSFISETSCFSILHFGQGLL